MGTIMRRCIGRLGLDAFFRCFLGFSRFRFRFELSRVRGSHHIFEHPNFRDILNLQNHKGQVKPYQIRQFLQLVEQYNLTLED